MPAQGKAPVIPLGTSEASVAGVRVGGYMITSGFILEGLDQFNVWHGTTGQTKWAMGALGILLTVITNYIEGRKSRRLVGTSVG